MLLNKLNLLEQIIRSKGMIYFLNNIDELDSYIYNLSELRTANSSTASKTVYYTLLELLELLQEQNENIDYEIKQLENKFFDYIKVIKN